MANRKHNRVDGKGRIVIPVKIREAMGIETGPCNRVRLHGPAPSACDPVGRRA